MSREHFKELREWSERKHKLVRAYVEGFTKILGGSSQTTVCYVDGCFCQAKREPFDDAKGDQFEYPNQIVMTEKGTS